jgi:hypothetical protein
MVHRYVWDNGHRLTIIQVNPMLKEIYDYVMMSLVSNDSFVTGTPCLNMGHCYIFASSVGRLRSNLVGLLVYDGMRTISRTPMLYYRSLGTASTLLGKGLILWVDHLKLNYDMIILS